MIHFPQASKGGGSCAGFPDVCKVPAPPAPPIPTPFPNTSQVRNSDKTIDRVLVKNKDIVVEDSEPSSSNGDEAGSLKGMMKAPKQMNETGFMKGSSKVYAKGKKVVPHLTPSKHNGANLPGGGVHCAPSQTDVITSP
ncbi:MAG: DUF4150 domain-containing protein [Sandaracinaceae bacterium]|nr:DUF4150 domain-containing protein [Sandaracinaceae bacterium]